MKKIIILIIIFASNVFAVYSEEIKPDKHLDLSTRKVHIEETAGKLVDADSKEPIAGAMVFVSFFNWPEKRSGYNVIDTIWTTTSNNGAFHFDSRDYMIKGKHMDIFFAVKIDTEVPVYGFVSPPDGWAHKWDRANLILYMYEGPTNNTTSHFCQSLTKEACEHFKALLPE